MTAKAIRACAAAVGVLAVTMSSVACGTKTPDYQSMWTTSSTTSAAPSPTQQLAPLPKYLESEGITGDAVAPGELTDLTVTIPIPSGWESRTPDPKTAPKAVMIAKGNNYPAAILRVYTLRGEFNPTEVIKHANAGLPQSFHQLDASSADFNGFPSSMVQGTYELKGARMRSWQRSVLATGSAPANQRYLIELNITSFDGQAVAESNDVEAIIRGFVVAKK